MSKAITKVITPLLAIVLASLGSPLAGQTYTSSAATYAINAYTENWTCNAFTSSRCYSTDNDRDSDDGTTVLKYTFFGAYVVRQGGTVYWYVQGGGADGGPGSRIRGDNFIVFTSPDTHAGQRGDGLVLVNDEVRPDDGFYQLRTAFFDPDFGKFFLTAVRTENGTTTDITWMEYALGESTDGVNFTWDTLLRFSKPAFGSGLATRFFDPVLIPDPNNNSRWIGTFAWREDNGSRPIGSTSWYIEPNTRKVYLELEDTWTGARRFKEYNFGDEITAWPSGEEPRRMVTNRIHDISLVDGQYEAITNAPFNTPYCETNWMSEGFSSEDDCAVYHEYCPPFADNAEGYASFLEDRNGGKHGSSRTVFWRFDPVGLEVGSQRTLQSTLRAFPQPADTSSQYTGLRTIQDLGVKDAVYTASQQAICTNDLSAHWNPWGGSGILFLSID